MIKNLLRFGEIWRHQAHLFPTDKKTEWILSWAHQRQLSSADGGLRWLFYFNAFTTQNPSLHYEFIVFPFEIQSQIALMISAKNTLRKMPRWYQKQRIIIIGCCFCSFLPKRCFCHSATLVRNSNEGCEWMVGAD